MARLNITVSETDLAWARSQVEAGKAATVEEYLVGLVTSEMQRVEVARELQVAIDKGLASGIDPRSPREIFRAARNKYLGAHA